MELEKVRIELPGGTYALVYKDVLRKTARLHEAELRKHMTPFNQFGDPKKVLRSSLKDNPQRGVVDYYIDFVAVDANNERINEIFILNQTLEWSFGPVTLEVLETGLTRDQYQLFVEEIDRLYKPSPLPGRGSVSSASTSSGQSLQSGQSQSRLTRLITLLKQIPSALRKS